MNVHAVRAIYTFEMARTGRTLLQSIISPVISTSLYFVVFGAAIGIASYLKLEVVVIDEGGLWDPRWGRLL